MSKKYARLTQNRKLVGKQTEKLGVVLRKWAQNRAAASRALALDNWVP
jgi:hypothetical protein